MIDKQSSGSTIALRYTLPNGLVALIQRNAASPTVSVRGEIRVGAVHERDEQSGLAIFTAAALIRGAGQRTFQEIVSTTESIGASVNAGAGMNAGGFAGRSLSEDLPLVLEILADMLMRPSFPELELERLRSQILMGLRENEQEPRTQASRAVREMLFPPGHPYRRLSSGTLETVEALMRSDLLAFHQLYHPASVRIAIVGDVEPAEVIGLLERTFGTWTSQHQPPEFRLPEPPALHVIKREDIQMAGKSQSDVVWAVHGLKRNADDFYAASMANMLLGRLGMGGRLGENVRERQGLAYYVGSGFEADWGAGPWAALAGVNPENVERTISAILHEIEVFMHEGPSPEELSDAHDFMAGSTVLGLESNDGIASTLLAIERYDLGLDYIARYPAIIRAVTAEEIIAAAQRYLSIDAYVLAVAGP